MGSIKGKKDKLIYKLYIQNLYNPKQVISKMEYFRELVKEIRTSQSSGIYTDTLIYEAHYSIRYLKVLKESRYYGLLSEGTQDILNSYYSLINMWLDDIDYRSINKDSNKYNIVKDKLLRVKGLSSYIKLRIAVIVGSIVTASIISSLLAAMAVWIATGAYAISILIAVLFIYYFILGVYMGVARGNMERQADYIVTSVIPVISMLVVTGFYKVIFKGISNSGIWVIISVVGVCGLYMLSSKLYYIFKDLEERVNVYSREEVNYYRVCFVEESLCRVKALSYDILSSQYETDTSQLISEARRIKDSIQRTSLSGKDYWEALAKAEIIYEGCLLAGIIDEYNYDNKEAI